MAHFGYHKWLAGSEDQVDDCLIRAANSRRLLFGAQAVRSAEAEAARFLIFKDDRAPLHGQGVGQYGQHCLKGLLEVQGLTDNLTNLVENL